MTATAPALQPKSHYQILDGLRGVAAITVVIFHTFEMWSNADHTKQIINHGYLAVDFFFLLSGFVIAYAYDDRWPRMSQWEFYKRRLIRLQPMVILGSIIGALLFYLQTGPAFPLISATPVWKVLVFMLVGATLLPVTPAMDIRGWQEMHPLNGPAWSLFFEYVANIFYAVGLRRVSNRVLAVLVFLAGIFLAQYAITSPTGDVIGGWAVDRTQLHIGFARLLFPFLAGMLLMRLGRRIHVRDGFGACSLLLVAVLAFPHVGGHAHLWANGLYDTVAIVLFFPLIVAMGAGSTIHSARSLRACRFLGDLSYPLYITHYPLIYVYTAWYGRKGADVNARNGILWGALLVCTAVAVGYAAFRLYDEPVRAWLTRRFLSRTPREQATGSAAVVAGVPGN